MASDNRKRNRSQYQSQNNDTELSDSEHSISNTHNINNPPCNRNPKNKKKKQQQLTLFIQTDHDQLISQTEAKQTETFILSAHGFASELKSKHLLGTECLIAMNMALKANFQQTANALQVGGQSIMEDNVLSLLSMEHGIATKCIKEGLRLMTPYGFTPLKATVFNCKIKEEKEDKRSPELLINLLLSKSNFTIDGITRCSASTKKQISNLTHKMRKPIIRKAERMDLTKLNPKKPEQFYTEAQSYIEDYVYPEDSKFKKKEKANCEFGDMLHLRQQRNIFIIAMKTLKVNKNAIFNDWKAAADQRQVIMQEENEEHDTDNDNE